MKKPIKVFYSILSGRFYASQYYKQGENATIITGAKFDVTDDIGRAVNQNGLTFIETKKKPKGTKEGE